MTQSKHTRGPWAFKENASSFSIFLPRAKHKIGLHVGEELNIAQVAKTKVLGAEAPEANARLIAAAPDLLQALEAIVAHYRAQGVDFIVAGAAIAKARGQS